MSVLIGRRRELDGVRLRLLLLLRLRHLLQFSLRQSDCANAAQLSGDVVRRHLAHECLPDVVADRDADHESRHQLVVLMFA